MTEIEKVETRNLMRIKEALRAQILQLVTFDVTSKVLAFMGVLFAMYLAFVVDTMASNIGALSVVTGAVCTLINGGILLHRKWDEYVSTEMEYRQFHGTWQNPSLNVQQSNRTAVAITGALSIGLPALTVVCYSTGRLAGLF